MDEVKRRLAIGKTSFNRHANILKDRQVPITLRLRLLQTLVFPVMLYGCESWSLTADLSRRIDAAEMWLYRRMLRISWRDRVRNEVVLQRIGRESLVLRSIMLRQKLTYFGHLVRHPGIDHDIMLGMVPGKRRQGRPQLQWTDDIRRVCGSVTEAVRRAKDRVIWRRTSHAAAAGNG